MAEMSISCEITNGEKGVLRPRYFPLLSPISPTEIRRTCGNNGTSYKSSRVLHRFVPIDVIEVSETSKFERRNSLNLVSSVEGSRYSEPLVDSNVELGEDKAVEKRNRKSIRTTEGKNRNQIETALVNDEVMDPMQFEEILIKSRIQTGDYSVNEIAERPTDEGEFLRTNVFCDSERKDNSLEWSDILVKLDAFKPRTVCSSWKNVSIDHSSLEIDGQFEDQLKRLLQQLNGHPNFNNFLNMNGKPFVTILPPPIEVESQIIDLNESIPGVIQQPRIIVEGTVGFPVAKIFAPFRPLVKEIDSTIINALKEFNADRSTLQKKLQKQCPTQNALPTLEDIPCIVQSLCKLLEIGLKRSEIDETQQGVRTHAGNVELYVIGQFVKIDKSEIFVPGYVIETCDGPSFVPGFVLRANEGMKFLPGFILKDEDNEPVFIAGQNTPTENGEKFVLGQFLQTNKGARFMPGQTVITPDGMKFIPGQIVPMLEESVKNTHRFVSGMSEGRRFITDQFDQNLSTNEEVKIIPGQSILNENGNWEFILGQNLKAGDGSHIFVPGKEFVDNEGHGHFVPGRIVTDRDNIQRFFPGMTSRDGDGNTYFVPGMNVKLNNDMKFLEGVLTITDNGDIAFAAGKVLGTNEHTIEFIYAKKIDDLILHDIFTCASVDELETSGQRHQTENVETISDQDQKIKTNKRAKFEFGKMLQTNKGLEFVPGQTIQIGNSAKFVPGLTFDTKWGPTFVPGQIFFLNEEIQKFVPGQVVDLLEGLRFVPGRILNDSRCIFFESSEIIETGGDLKFVPTNLEDHPVNGYQFKLQGLNTNAIDVERSSRTRFLCEVDVHHKTVSGESVASHFASPEVERNCEDTTRDFGKTKLELEETISKILDRLGEGLCSPVAYDTAWVARVPQARNIGLPAFPLSLQWLRDNQLEDGTWGSIQQFHAHSSTLNTLAAIIALAQWDYPEDRVRIERGTRALWALDKHLSSETHETIGFELLLPALISEALKYSLDIPCQHYKVYEEKGRKKLNLMLLDFRKHGASKPATWWHSLEALGDTLEMNLDDETIGFLPSMLVNGSVGASPSATAHLLRSQRLKGVDVPEAAEYLEKIYSFYGGGISQVFPIDIFELAFSMDYFLKAGFSAKHNSFIEAVKRLSERCNSRGMIGFSSYFKVPDSDDMAVALYVLHIAGYEISVEHLLPFYNGTHVSTFINEMNFSLSANVNVLRTLRLFQGMEKVDGMIEKIVTCLESQASSAKQVFVDDKWHNSPYYSSSRAVFALHGLRNDIAERCLDFFVKCQNPDGGWGRNGVSTAEETAYVVLALCFSFKNGYPVPRYVLEKANEYLRNPKTEFHASLWLGKVLYRPTLVAESAIIAARYSLAQAFQRIEVENILEETQPDCIEFNLKIEEHSSFSGVVLCPTSEFDIDKYSDQSSRVQTFIVNRLIEVDLIKSDKKVMESSAMKGVLYTLRSELIDEDVILYATAGMAIFIYDDILDKQWQLFRNKPIVVKHAFQTFLKILHGRYENINMIPPTDFPKFLPLCELFFDIRLRITRKRSEIEKFLVATEKVFNSLIEEAFNRSNNIIIVSPHSYLESSKFTFDAYMMIYLGLIIKNVNFSSFEDYSVFHEFEDCGLKAASLIDDIVSVSRDLDEGSLFDNYVLLRQAETNCRLEDALSFSIQLYNQQVIKMNHLKKKMQHHPKYKSDQELFKVVAVYENFIQGVLDWVLETKRYRPESIVSFSRKKLTKPNFPLVTSFFTV